jgi:hypothetical protein
MRAVEFVSSKKGVHPKTGPRPTYVVGPEVEHTHAFGKKTLIVNEITTIDEIEAIFDQYKCKNLYLEVTYALSKNKNTSKVLADYRKVAKYFLDRKATVTIDIPTNLAYKYADLTTNKNFVMNIAIEIPHMERLKDRVSLKVMAGEYENDTGGIYVAHLDDVRVKKYFTPWDAYAVDVKVVPKK